MTKYKALAIVDDVHTCDCCGKSNLKSTVAMEDEAGEVVYFGSVCATRHSGRDLAAIKREIDEAHRQAVEAASKEYKRSAEHLAAAVKMNAAHKLNLSGKEFRNHCRAEQDAATTKRAEIAAKYNVQPYEIH